MVSKEIDEKLQQYKEKMDEVSKKNYKLAGLEAPLSAADINAIRFDKETQNQEKRYRINAVYRIRVAGKENILFNATRIAQTQIGNEKTDSGLYGRRSIRTWNYKLNESEQRVPINVASERTEYLIPFTTQTLQEILESGDANQQEPMFYVEIPGIGSPYGGFSAQEILTKSFDDLMYKGSNGFYPEKPLQNPDAEANAVTTRKLVEDKKGLMKEKEYTESPDRYSNIVEDNNNNTEEKELSGSEKVFKQLDDAEAERKRIQQQLAQQQSQPQPKQPQQQRRTRKQYYSQASKVNPDDTTTSNNNDNNS